MSSDLRRHWTLDPEITFLNHGSFGATPRAVLAHQAELRAQLEREPVRFFLREVPELWAETLQRVAAFIGADPGGIALVANATTGVNTALSAVALQPGDEIVVTDHEYNACRNAVNRVAERTNATVKVATVPLPIECPSDVVDALVSKLSSKTKLVLIDHVTSQTGIIMPVAEIAARCRERGIQILVDGAHAPGMLDLNVTALDVDYYTGNFHKWVCSPKSGAALWVAPQHRDRVHPLVTSHGASAATSSAAERFRAEFDWVGTIDPTSLLSIPCAIDHMESLLPGGWPAIRKHNHELVSSARTMLCAKLGVQPLCPSLMLGSTASIELPVGGIEPPQSPLYLDHLQDQLLTEYGIEVPIIPWPAPPHRLLRVSAQLYNSAEQYELLADALSHLLSD